MLSQIRECGQIRKPIKLKCQGSKLRFIVWYENCSVRGEKKATLQRIRKKYTYEMDKINAQNYMKFSKKSTDKVFESMR